MNITEALAHVVAGGRLSASQAREAMTQMVKSEATPAQVGALLAALATRGESVEELIGGAEALRDLMVPVRVENRHDVVDIVGTGGDGSMLFNVSTAASFVVAACGARVAKHGNKAVSGASGAADAVQALGGALTLGSSALEHVFARCGFCFMYAPLHHGALKSVAGLRRELKVRTLFNMLGPLANPASVGRHLLGVFSPELLEPYAQILQRFESRCACIVHSDDGLDEFSVAAPSSYVWLDEKGIQTFKLDPREYGMDYTDLSGLKAQTAEESVKLILEAFSGENRKARDTVALNAGVALVVAGVSQRIDEGIMRAHQAMDDGLAEQKAREYARLTQKEEGA